MQKLTLKRQNVDWKEVSKEGDPVLPKLFTCVMEHKFRKLNWSSKRGRNMNGNKLIN